MRFKSRRKVKKSESPIVETVGRLLAASISDICLLTFFAINLLLDECERGRGLLPSSIMNNFEALNKIKKLNFRDVTNVKQ